jgi:uncharacterized repeat protein (TIGR04138 family)
VNNKGILEKLERIAAEDGRYSLEAYVFLMNALDLVSSRTEMKTHVSGEDLLQGVREYGQHRFGPTARLVFEHWGVRSTGDFGNIVFSLVDAGILGKSETDSPEDFIGVYDFSDVFEKQYDWKLEEPL